MFLGAGHNDVELHAAYLDRLRSFIDHEATPRKDSVSTNRVEELIR